MDYQLLWKLHSWDFSWSDTYASTSSCQEPKAYPEEDLYAWCAAGNNNPSSYLQVDLGHLYIIESVSTYGRLGQWKQYVTSYNLQYSDNEFEFISDDISNPMQGNVDQTNEQKNELNPSIIARYLRFTPVTYFGHKSVEYIFLM